MIGSNESFLSVKAAVVEALDGKGVACFPTFEAFVEWVEAVLFYDAMDYSDMDESFSLGLLRPVYDELCSEGQAVLCQP